MNGQLTEESIGISEKAVQEANRRLKIEFLERTVEILKAEMQEVKDALRAGNKQRELLDKDIKSLDKKITEARNYAEKQGNEIKKAFAERFNKNEREMHEIRGQINKMYREFAGVASTQKIIVSLLIGVVLAIGGNMYMDYQKAEAEKVEAFTKADMVEVLKEALKDK